MKIEDSESFESAIARHLLCDRSFPLPEGPLDENSSPTGRAGLLGAAVAAQTSTPSQNVLESLANWHQGQVEEELVRMVLLTRPEVILVGCRDFLSGKTTALYRWQNARLFILNITCENSYDFCGTQPADIGWLRGAAPICAGAWKPIPA
jgi:hypothetical protein